MKTSLKGIDLIASSEGVRLKAYRDTGGIWTIGFGHTKDVKEGDVITLNQAKIMLAYDLAERERQLNTLGLNLNQNQYDACIDLIYNCGIGNFMKSDIFKRIKANSDDPMLRVIWPETYVHDRAGNEPPGLKIRRKKELALYSLPI